VPLEEMLIGDFARTHAATVREVNTHDGFLIGSGQHCMFGDILSDLVGEISGSLGLAASLNAGADHAVAQAQHGSAPDIACQDRANPASLIGSAGMLLAWLGERRGHEPLLRAAAAIDDALEIVISDPASRTAGLRR
jgi:isocitrate/isopropylmalate dehydrogenase